MGEIDLLEKRVGKLELRMGDLLTREGPHYLKFLEIQDYLISKNVYSTQAYTGYQVLGNAGGAVYGAYQGMYGRDNATSPGQIFLTSDIRNANANAGTIYLRQYDGSAWNVRLYIAKDGLTWVGNGTTNTRLHISGAAGCVRDLSFNTGTSYRWLVRVNATAESGGNAGSDFEIRNRDDSGNDIARPFWITRSDGLVRIGDFNADQMRLVVGRYSAGLPYLRLGTNETTGYTYIYSGSDKPLYLGSGSEDVYLQGKIRANNKIIGGAITSGTATLNDNAATNFTPSNTYGLMLLAPYTAVTWYGFVIWRVGSGNFCGATSSPNVNCYTTPLYGSTGNDGTLNIGAASDGKLYVENRTGAQLGISWTLIGGTT